MGSHGSYNINLEIAKVHQHQLRGERAEDRLALGAGNQPLHRPAGYAAPVHSLSQSLRVLALRCMPLRKSSPTPE
jgi:hypothetical protein